MLSGLRWVPVLVLSVVALTWPVVADAQTPAPSAPDAPAGQPLARSTSDEPWRFGGPPPPALPATVARDESGKVTARAVRLTERLRIDGELDESIYSQIEPIDGFTQTEPSAGAPATEKTDVWILFDDENLYVAGRCWDSAPEDRWVANELRRDNGNLGQNDSFAVTFDTFYDRRNGYIFEITPIGGFYDGDITNGQNNLDWNPVWSMKPGRFEGGWSFEMAIPFRSLRYQPGRAQVWGMNMRRVVFWKNESSFASPVPASFGRSGIFQIALGGTLVGLEVPPASNNLEIKPYGIAGVTTDRIVVPSVSNDPHADFGVDMKYSLTQNLTADFTYNTDFAQVETDEQQVNLTRFSLFFPEKREFFLEGRGNFAFAGLGGSAAGGDAPTIFFSRQIGLSRGQPVPIIAGGRVTGKMGRYSIGLLNIQTDEVLAANATSTNFSVVRVKRDILRRSSIGGIFTGRSQSVLVDGSNTVYGVDTALGFGADVNITSYLAKSVTAGVSGRDLSYRADLNYAGDRYGLEVDRLVIEERFNPEVGFVRRPDMRKSFLYGRFSPRPDSAEVVRKFIMEGSVNHIENNAGVLETREGIGTFGADFNNGDQFRTSATRSYELLTAPFRIASDVIIPPGGYDFGDVQVNYTVSQQRRVSGSVNVTRGTFYDGHITSLGATRGRIGLTLRLAVEPGVSVNWIDLPQGSFTTTLVQNRLVYTMSPRMFFTAFVQYNTSNDSMAANLRFRWEYQPGSELFVVYTDERDTALRGFPQLKNRAFVVKANRLLRF